MRNLTVGDKVRFLNTIGGGTVKGFQSKQIVIVEDEHGFDVPVLISECVVIEPAKDERMVQTAEEENIAKADTPQVIIDESDEPEETPEGENITACLAFLPMDIKSISTTSFEAYFVNDSNYYLFMNYMSRENNTWTSRYNGIVEPNTKVFIEEFEKSTLNEMEKVCVQFVAFKHKKPYKFKSPCSVELRIDTVKFYKLHSFRENDYFEDDAIIYYIIRDDRPEQDILISAGDLERAMREKEAPEKREPKQPVERKLKSRIIEVDLHINELLDSTAGMGNAEILEYQLKKFNEVMTENLRVKNRKIVFIHGKGDGVLKSALLKELKQKYPRCYYQDASFKEYGFGATMVTIK